MDYFLVGTLSFVLFFMFDLFQIGKLPEVFRFCFLPGCAMSAYSLIGLIFLTPFPLGYSRLNLFFLIPAFLFLLITLYSLFFALPAEKTYSAESGRMTIDYGVYALCRHPGVFPLSMTLLFLWLALRKNELLLAALVWTALNLILVTIEDIYIFPKLFSDYNSYKKKVPFLIPTKQSIGRCVLDLKRGPRSNKAGAGGGNSLGT
jgi:protein-S-isoprenylcysteine O-methyltransferase Ste14